ncbi:hypothetical protein E2C01_040961 [Portunus trituberculatus]|uniref:Uncharacterized protein n=1 Tax=Portunus trituberculatus TaxID=210409 RepID=A0A5B7FIS2_PORTR|nr:hypothetical protein [Portunus trituberculatus]
MRGVAIGSGLAAEGTGVVVAREGEQVVTSQPDGFVQSFGDVTSPVDVVASAHVFVSQAVEAGYAGEVDAFVILELYGEEELEGQGSEVQAREHPEEEHVPWVIPELSR